MKLFTLLEVAERLSVSQFTVRRLIRSGALAVVLVGRQYRVRPSDLEDYIAECRVASTAERRRAQIRALPDLPAPRRALRPGYWGE